MLLQKDQKFNPIIFWRTRKYLVLTAALIIAAVGIIAFGAYPQLKAGLEIRSKAASLQPKLESLEKKLAQLENVRFEPEFQQVDVVNEALPSKKPLLELLTNLSGISLAHEIAITEFKLSPGVISTDSAQAKQARAGDVDTLEVQFRIEGEQQNVNDFLTSIEKISPFTTITKLTISTTENSEGQLSNADMVTNTFFFTKPITTTVDSPLPQIAEQEKMVLDELAGFEIPDLTEQTEITGGGLEDLFGVDPLQFEN